MWEEVVRRRGRADAGASGDVLAAVDSLDVYCQSWQYDDPAGRLAEALGHRPAHRLYSGIGGTTPQVLVDDRPAILARRPRRRRRSPAPRRSTPSAG